MATNIEKARERRLKGLERVKAIKEKSGMDTSSEDKELRKSIQQARSEMSRSPSATPTLKEIADKSQKVATSITGEDITQKEAEEIQLKQEIEKARSQASRATGSPKTIREIVDEKKVATSITGEDITQKEAKEMRRTIEKENKDIPLRTKIAAGIITAVRPEPEGPERVRAGAEIIGRKTAQFTYNPFVSDEKKVLAPQEPKDMTGKDVAASIVFSPGFILAAPALIAAPQIGVELAKGAIEIEAIRQVGKGVSQLTVSEEQREFLKTERSQKAIAKALKEEEERISKQGGVVGTIQSATFGLSPLLGGSRKEIETSLRRQELNEKEIAAALRQIDVGSVGEIGGLISISRRAEEFGRKEVARVFGQSSDSFVIKEIGKADTGFWNIFGKTAPQIGQAGIIEGAGQELSRQRFRGEDINVENILGMGAVGGISAGTIGGTIAGTSITSPKLSKSLELGIFVSDPTERPADVLQDIIEGSASRRAAREISEAKIFTDDLFEGGVKNINKNLQRAVEKFEKAPISPVLTVSPTSTPTRTEVAFGVETPAAAQARTMVPIGIGTPISPAVPQSIPQPISPPIPPEVPIGISPPIPPSISPPIPPEVPTPISPPVLPEVPTPISPPVSPPVSISIPIFTPTLDLPLFPVLPFGGIEGYGPRQKATKGEKKRGSRSIFPTLFNIDMPRKKGVEQTGLLIR